MANHQGMNPDDDDPALEAFTRILQEVKDGTAPEVFVLNQFGEIRERTTFAEWASRGRVDDCDCNLISCVCELARQHELGCRYRFALTCAVAVACEPHGRDVCEKCDPCTCGPSTTEQGTQESH